MVIYLNNVGFSLELSILQTEECQKSHCMDIHWCLVQEKKLHLYMDKFLHIHQVTLQNEHHWYLYAQTYFHIKWFMC